MEPLDLVGLIASRIFHDFAGPIGAITNGTELLIDEPDPAVRAEFIAILGSAAEKLAARLKLYRMMLGAGHIGDRVRPEDARAALSDLLDAETRVALDWRVTADTISRDESRLLLALSMLGAEALSRGGVLSVLQVGAAHDGVGWTVDGQGPRAALTADVVSVLGGGAGVDAGSRAALAHFARAVAGRLGLTVLVEAHEDAVKLVARN